MGAHIGVLLEKLLLEIMSKMLGFEVHHFKGEVRETIIMDDVYRNLTFIMTLASLAVLSHVSFIFTTFVYVARQVGLTHWHTVGMGMQNDIGTPAHSFT